MEVSLAYAAKKAIVTDEEYDQLKLELREQNSKVTQQVRAQPSGHAGCPASRPAGASGRQQSGCQAECCCRNASGLGKAGLEVHMHAHRSMLHCLQQCSLGARALATRTQG